MKTLLPSLVIAALLSACGGGGSDSSATTAAPVAAASTPASSATPAASTPATTTTTTALADAPAVPTGTTNLTARTFNNSSSATNYVVNFSGATDLNVVGNLNNLWLGAAQAGGSVTVDGASNTIVFKPTSTPTTVSVTGSANTFYLPEGSAITLTGTGAAMSTVKYYKA
jgi:hypothetical protein